MSGSALEEFLPRMAGPLTLMNLDASRDVADLYRELATVVGQLASTDEDDKRMALSAEFSKAFHAFIDAARADIGTDDLLK